MKATKAEMNAYLAEQFESWLAADSTHTQKAAAKIAAVSEAQLSNLRRGTRGAGIETLRGLARLLGKTWDEIEADASERAKTRPQRLRLADGVVQLEARYHNLGEAIRIRRSKVLDITVQRISAIALHWPEDRSVGDWLDEIDQLDRQFRRELRIVEAEPAELPRLPIAGDAHAAESVEERRTLGKKKRGEPSEPGQ